MSTFANDDNDTLSYGIYEALLDEGLRDALLRHPELWSVLSKIDPEEQPSRGLACASLCQPLRILLHAMSP